MNFVDDQMRARVVQEVEEIERSENVKVLFACESGSRAWGFPSVDSDYDVRFLYVRPTEWYLSIFPGRDVLEYPIDDELDVSGWDLQKALGLFHKSNPALLEWLQSPIIYKESGPFTKRLRDLMAQVFKAKSCIYHYRSMAKTNYREYLKGDTVRLKKYFYVLRPILSCMWIEAKGNVPPMEFKTLVDEFIPEGTARQEIDELLQRKMAGDELVLGPRIPGLNQFLEEKLTYFEEYAGKMPVGGIPEVTLLNELLCITLEEEWGSKL